MKILIIGMGSIGQRHLVNMMMLDKNNLFASISNPIKQRIVKNNNKTIIKKNIYDYYGERLIYLKNKKDIQEFGPDAVLICNFSNKHITAALPYLKDNIHVFIEKPLATSQSDLLKIKKIVGKTRSISMVGFQERFNPCIKFVKKTLNQNKEGSLLIAHFNWETNIKQHRPYENFKNSYATNKKYGGGVIHSLSHELDLIIYFFGMPKKIFCMKGKSSLNTKAEEAISAVLSYSNSFLVTLNLSFCSHSERRDFTISTTKSKIICDIQKSKVKIFKNNKLQTIKKFQFKRNDLFISELRNFLNSIKNNESTLIPITEGIKSSKLALKLHEAMSKNKVLEI